jgi:hypothetical protein
VRADAHALSCPSLASENDAFVRAYIVKRTLEGGCVSESDSVLRVNIGEKKEGHGLYGSGDHFDSQDRLDGRSQYGHGQDVGAAGGKKMIVPKVRGCVCAYYSIFICIYVWICTHAAKKLLAGKRRSSHNMCAHIFTIFLPLAGKK